VFDGPTWSEYVVGDEVVQLVPELGALQHVDRWRWWPVNDERGKPLALVGKYDGYGYVDLLYVYGDSTGGAARVDIRGPAPRTIWTESGALSTVVAGLIQQPDSIL
jgi:hypothetical protein